MPRSFSYPEKDEKRDCQKTFCPCDIFSERLLFSRLHKSGKFRKILSTLCSQLIVFGSVCVYAFLIT